jgi:adenylate cyclase
VAGPLNAVARDLERVGRFELSPGPSPSSFVKEIAVVGTAVDRMKAGLRSFSHYAPTEIVRDLLAHGEEARRGGENRRLTIQFSDVEGYTRIGELMEPGELVGHIGEYLEAMTAILRDEQATIDKYLGDGILAFFNAPHDVADHVARACRAAIRSQERLRELGVEWALAGKPVLRARIGFHVGEVLVGNIGTRYRFEYTVVGDAVNVASRLESINKLYGTSILASEEVRQAAGSDFEWRTVDLVAVVGRERGTLVCELLGERGAVAPGILRARDVYEAALDAYLAGRFTAAAAGFREAAALRPHDLAAVELGRRAEALAREPLPDDWDGVYAQPAKL